MFRNKDYRHFISINDCDRQDIYDFLTISQRIEKRPDEYRSALQGKKMARLFWPVSTRTYDSHGDAMIELGGMAHLGFRGAKGTSAEKGESFRSTIEMYDQAYKADVIVMRHDRDGSAQYAADIAQRAWIINGGDGNREHPTQNLLDILAIYKLRGSNPDSLNGMTIVFFGDLYYGRTTRLAWPLSLFEGNRFVFFSHELLQVPQYVKDLLDERDADYKEVTDLDMMSDLIHEADFFYGSRLQMLRWPQEGRPEGDRLRQEALDEVVLTKDDIESADPKDDFAILHPLPINEAHPVISKDARETRHYKGLFQSEQGVPARKGLHYSQFNDWWEKDAA